MRYFKIGQQIIRVHVKPHIKLTDPEFDRARADRFSTTLGKWMPDPNAKLDLLYAREWESCGPPKQFMGGRQW